MLEHELNAIFLIAVIPVPITTSTKDLHLKHAESLISMTASGNSSFFKPDSSNNAMHISAYSMAELYVSTNCNSGKFHHHCLNNQVLLQVVLPVQERCNFETLPLLNRCRR